MLLIVQAFLLRIVVMRGLKKMFLVLGRKEKLVLLGDFNARFGRSAQIDDVIGTRMSGENVCNASGNRLLSFLNEVRRTDDL